jgi:cytochrome c oxidase subunit III
MSVAINSGNFTGSRYRIGMWVALASMAMLFTSLSSAYVVRSGTANDWSPIPAPRILFVSTALLLISSVTIEIARRKLKHSFQGAYSRYLLLTVLIGVGFFVSQLIAWKQLAAQGIYLSSHPHSSFFYLLSGTHLVHVVGGLLAMIFLWLGSRRTIEEPVRVIKRQASADAVTIYWHFMDALWIYLFLLLFLWR